MTSSLPTPTRSTINQLLVVNRTYDFLKRSAAIHNLSDEQRANVYDDLAEIISAAAESFRDSDGVVVFGDLL